MADHTYTVRTPGGRVVGTDAELAAELARMDHDEVWLVDDATGIEADVPWLGAGGDPAAWCEALRLAVALLDAKRERERARIAYLAIPFDDDDDREWDALRGWEHSVDDAEYTILRAIEAWR